MHTCAHICTYAKICSLFCGSYIEPRAWRRIPRDYPSLSYHLQIIMENILFGPYLAIAQQAMISVWNRTPCDFQNESMPHLLMIRCATSAPSDMLLAQGAGGRKSAMLQTVGAVTCSATLIVENTLSLSADQRSKIKKAKPGHGPIESFHLHSTRTERNQQKLCKALDNLLHNTDATAFLFSSPELLLKEP